MYYVFIISFNNKLISVIIDNDFGWEHTFVCFCTKILIPSC